MLALWPPPTFPPPPLFFPPHKDVWYVSVGVGSVCFERLTFFVCGIKRREYGL